MRNMQSGCKVTLNFVPAKTPGGWDSIDTVCKANSMTDTILVTRVTNEFTIQGIVKLVNLPKEGALREGVGRICCWFRGSRE